MTENTITESDILRYIYCETSAEENVLIRSAIKSNPCLAQFCRDTIKSLSWLDRNMMTPNESVIQMLREETTDEELTI